jgi:aminomethyltransferase
MPVLYTSIVAEHHAVRTQAGIFDVSHMGEVRLRGPSAIGLAERIFTNHASKTGEGRVRYGLLCLEDGGVVDDVTLLRTGPEEVLLCVNAANIEADLDWIREVDRRERFGCDVIDESPETGLLAVQGPEVRALIDRLLPANRPAPRPWRFAATEVAGIAVLLSGTGYTGEDGFEIFVPGDRAAALWDALLEAGQGRLVPAGLGARDTLRTEMAYSLYGHEIDRSRNPIEAGLERFVAFGTGFIGEEAIAAVRDEGPAQQKVGLVLEQRTVARPGTPILDEGPVGTVTSGTYGPTVERSIGIGYVPAQYASVGTSLAVEIRGRRVPCSVTETPFYGRKG